MSVLHIPCPNCRKELKVRDPSLLGRKAKCPACEHRFILQWGSEPEEESTAAVAPPQSPVPTIDVTPREGVGQLRQLQQRRRQRRNRNLLVVGVCLALLGCGYFLVRDQLPAKVSNSAPVATAQTDANHVPQPVMPASTSSTWVEELSPTSGEPIQLRMVPSGVRLIVNLRPAQLWSNDPRMAELRASLTQNVTGWLETQLRTVCRHEPAEIEEVLLGWILGSRGTEPELVAVVHLVNEARMSDLLDEFGGDAIDELAQPKVYRKGDHATLILDTKTFAIAPVAYGSELAEWVETPNFNTSDGIADLLPLTDRQRLLTVLFEPADMKRHLELLVSEPVRPVLSRVSEWFAADAETVAWSLHTGEAFHSELLVRGPRTISSTKVEEQFKQRLERLPNTMVDLVSRMRPQRSGFRQLIGRFPAMLEVFRMATISSLEGKAVRLLTVMPPKAAPNLALGTVLTWDESTRTDFSADAPPMVQASTQLPETVVGRLALPVDAEFNRVPLQEALDYIAGEMNVAVEIDGDALKDAGFTKNMAQTFTLGKVSAGEALAHIVGQYSEPGKEMVVVIDEPRRTFIVLTRKFADQRGLTVYEFGS